MNTLKRILGTTLIIFGLAIILLGVASAAGILVIVACPFLALKVGAEFWDQTKRDEMKATLQDMRSALQD